MIRPRAHSALIATAVIAAAAILPSAAETQAEPPARPKLESVADTNDWEAYYTAGMRTLQRPRADAEPYFYWAARLAPGRAEAQFGRWVSFWRREHRLWERYVAEERDVLESARVTRVDSLRLRSLYRNPFVHQGAMMLLYFQLPGDRRHDPRTTAWLRYAGGEYREAAEVLGKEMARRPERRRVLGYERSLSFVALGELDSAAVEIRALLDLLRSRDSAEAVRVYESKELLEYGLGLLYMARGDTAGARDALQRALTEDLTFAPAHEALGRLALLRGDTSTAMHERAQAVELVPDDPYFRQQYGAALLVAGRAKEAREQFQRAIALEPYFADPYYGLAASHDIEGDLPAAAKGYREYLTRAPRRVSSMRQHAERRISALASPGP